jgi:hypothetical protein
MPLNVYDEGLILAGADRILKGHLPYVHFWSIYPPGQFYALALLFKLFGSSVLVERIYDIIVKSLLSIFSFLITRKLGFSNKIAIISWGMSLIWTGSGGFAAYPVYAAILFIFISVYFFLYHIEKNQVQLLIFSGSFMALGAMFRHDLAGMATFAILITLFLRKITDTEIGYRPIFYYIFAVLLAVLPVSIYLINAIGIQPMINQLIITPADIMPKYRWLPYPSSISLNTIQFFIFPLILLIGFFASLMLIIKHKMHSKFSYGMFLLSLMGIFFINQVRVRSDNIHLLPVALVSIAIMPSLFSFMLSSSLNKLTPRGRWILAFELVIVLSTIFLGPLGSKVKSFNSDYFVVPNRPAIAAAGYSSMAKDLQDLVLYIQKNTTVNEAIYIGVKNHDQFIINDVIIYVLAGRQYATKYHELHPGVTTTSSIQKEIIEELRNSSVRMIVLAPRYWYEPNYTKIDSKIDLLDNYISANYEIIKRYGAYEVWVRKS